MKKIYKNLLAILGIIILLAGCSQNEEETGKTDSTTKLKIGTLPIEDILPMLVAKEKGYFADENLEIELIPFQSASESESAIQSGELDGMVTDLIVATLLKNTGLDTKITSVTLGASPGENLFAIVAAPNAKISSIEDLKGKKIGISRNSIIEYVTDELLKNAGISPSEVNKVSIPKIPVRMEMLLNNEIDAITVPDPMVTFAQFKGASIVKSDAEENLSQAVIIMQEKALNNKADAIKSFYNAYEKAANDINSSPEDYKKLLEENTRIPEPIADQYEITRYPSPQLPKKEDINRVLEWMKNKDLLQKELTYTDLVEKDTY